MQSYQLNVDSAMTVLDTLEQISLILDNTLMYRHLCHHSACGTSALHDQRCPETGACTTCVLDLNSATVVLEPLHGFKREIDLVVDSKAGN